MENIIHKTTIEILRYVLTGKAVEITQDIDFNELYAFSKSHGVENMFYVGLKELKIDVPDNIMEKFRQAYEIQIMVEAAQALELEAIGRAFEEAEIDYIPLKGSVIKYLYPMPDYRKSGDIDILVKENCFEKASQILESLEYTEDLGSHDHPVHRIFKKAPCIMVELHKKLARKTERAVAFYDCVWEYTCIEEQDHHLKMTNEYLYVYCLAHFCKHLYYGGIGISHLNDLYILKKQLSLNNYLITELLECANLSEINKLADGLINKWYGDLTVADEDVLLLEQIVLNSGTFGSKEFRYALTNSQGTGGKVLRALKKIFPNKEVLKDKYCSLNDNRPTIQLLMYHWYYTVKNNKKSIGMFVKETTNSKASNAQLRRFVNMINEK